MMGETAANKVALAFDLLCFLSCDFLSIQQLDCLAGMEFYMLIQQLLTDH
jgi:hypothetical protein